MSQRLISAFQQTRNEFSTDRVVADPELNKTFLGACRELGLDGSDAELNKRLLNLRKAGKLGKLKSKRTQFDDSEYAYAAEIAVRHMERRDSLTLDDILVDPNIASEFDEICSDISPGYSSLQYRWAALRLRKSRNLKPEFVGQAIQANRVVLLPVESINVEELPNAAGIYCFLSQQETLYIGEAVNLRLRLKKHLDHSDNKNLARYLWEFGFRNLSLELHIYEREISTKIRRAIELELIQSRRPIFNIQGVDDANR